MERFVKLWGRLSKSPDPAFGGFFEN